MSGKIESRLSELGIALPAAAGAAGNYVPYVITGNLVFVAGQIPIEDGKLPYIGKVGGEVDLESAQAAARLCALNIIAQVKAACGGDLDRVRRVVKLVGFVNSTPDFGDQPEVVNGASDLMVQVFGEAGKHARAAVSAGSLPRNVTVEVDAVVEIA